MTKPRLLRAIDQPLSILREFVAFRWLKRRHSNSQQHESKSVQELRSFGISFVLGSYNRFPLLVKAIDSIRSHDVPVPFEIIVIDGGSTDGTMEWLSGQKDIISIIQHNHGEFRGRPVERRSWGYFMNLGFKIAQGKFILMMSDDCVLLPNAVTCAMARIRELERQNHNIVGVAFYFRNWPLEKDYYVQKTLGGKLMVNHGLFLKTAIESVGWADEERYIFYKADSDLCLKLWQAGYTIVDAPGAFVEHYVDPSETLRVSNNTTLGYDRKTYLRRWGSQFSVQDCGRVTISFDDPSHTAEKTFGDLSAAPVSRQVC